MGDRPDYGWGSQQVGQSNRDKMFAKMKENPLLPVATACLLGIAGYRLYKFKQRDKTLPMSMYLIETRLFAQGTCAAILTMFAGYEAYTTLSGKNKTEEKKK